jgi:hypothetical protein
MQAGFRANQVQVDGRYVDYARTSDEQDRKVHVFHFCPDCGGTVFCTEPDDDEVVVVMVGAFADPEFPSPTESGYGARRHQWFVLPAGIADYVLGRQLQPGSTILVARKNDEEVDITVVPPAPPEALAVSATPDAPPGDITVESE